MADDAASGRPAPTLADMARREKLPDSASAEPSPHSPNLYRTPQKPTKASHHTTPSSTEPRGSQQGQRGSATSEATNQEGNNEQGTARMWSMEQVEYVALPSPAGLYSYCRFERAGASPVLLLAVGNCVFQLATAPVCRRGQWTSSGLVPWLHLPDDSSIVSIAACEVTGTPDRYPMVAVTYVDDAEHAFLQIYGVDIEPVDPGPVALPFNVTAATPTTTTRPARSQSLSSPPPPLPPPMVPEELDLHLPEGVQAIALEYSPLLLQFHQFDGQSGPVIFLSGGDNQLHVYSLERSGYVELKEANHPFPQFQQLSSSILSLKLHRLPSESQHTQQTRLLVVAGCSDGLILLSIYPAQANDSPLAPPHLIPSPFIFRRPRKLRLDFGMEAEEGGGGTGSDIEVDGPQTMEDGRVHVPWQALGEEEGQSSWGASSPWASDGEDGDRAGIVTYQRCVDGPVSALQMWFPSDAGVDELGLRVADLCTRGKAHVHCPEEPPSLLVATALGSALRFADILGPEPLAQQQFLPHSDRFDSITCMCTCDVNLDGRDELLVGTYSQELLIYAQQKNGQWELREVVGLGTPIYAIDSVRSRGGSGLPDIIVVCMHAVHIFQWDAKRAERLLLHKLGLLQDIAELEGLLAAKSKSM